MVLRVLVQRQRSPRDEEGAYAVIMCLLMSGFLLVLASMVVDLGLARDMRMSAQNAADASSLAAANALYPVDNTPDIPGAVAAAKSFAAANYGTTEAEWQACVDPSKLSAPASSTACISFDDAVRPLKVRVLMPQRAVDSNLNAEAPQIGIAASARSAVVLRSDSRQPCGLCVIGSGVTHDFQNGDATVNGGDVYINGSSRVSNQGLVASTGSIFVEGSALGGDELYQPDAVTGVPPISDPFRQVVLPPDMTSLSPTPKSDPCVQGPGYYGAVDLRNRSCVLAPGLYVVTAGDWDLAGNSSTRLSGTGVTIYLTCATETSYRRCGAAGESGASINASGSGNMDLQAASSPATAQSGALPGLTIVMDPANTRTMRLTGNGTAGFTGAIYAKRGRIQMNGNGCASGIRSMIVVSDIEFNGNPACLTINYNAADNPAPIPRMVSMNLDE